MLWDSSGAIFYFKRRLIIYCDYFYSRIIQMVEDFILGDATHGNNHLCRCRHKSDARKIYISFKECLPKYKPLITACYCGACLCICAFSEQHKLTTLGCFPFFSSVIIFVLNSELVTYNILPNTMI